MESKKTTHIQEPGPAQAGMGDAQGPIVDLKRRGAVRTSLSALLGGITVMAVGGLGAQKAQAGFGPCCKCECRSFEGSGDLCTNCGHQYADHGCMK
jgi:hypothetical protein